MSRHRRSPAFNNSFSPNNFSEHSSRNTDKMTQGGLRSLCLSNIPPKLSDSNLYKAVDKEFTRFGEFQVSITNYNGERVAYLNFKYPNEAQNAMERMQPFEIDSRRINIRPIYNWGRKWSPSGHPRRSRSPASHYRRNESPPSTSPNRGNHRDKFQKVIGSPHSTSPRLNSREKYPFGNTPSRTLFLGNLSNEANEETLLRKFSKHGKVCNVDVKANQRSLAFAFIRFATVEMAIRAKEELDGDIIDGVAMKVGFGKPCPSPCVSIGGLGPWVEFEELEREVVVNGRGVDRLEWPRNKSQAFVLFGSVREAVDSLEELRALKFGKRRVLVDYVELSYFKDLYGDDSGEDNAGRRSQSKRAQKSSRQKSQSRHHRPRSPQPRHWRSTSRPQPSQSRPRVTLSTCRDTQDMFDCLRGVWAGKLLLHKHRYGCRFFRLRGDDSLVEKHLLEDSAGRRQTAGVARTLTVSKTMVMEEGVLRGLEEKMEEVRGRHYCLLLASSYSLLSSTLFDDALQPPQPIKHLVEYLRARSSSAVVCLPSQTALLHVFPPCDFAFEILRQKAPNLAHKSIHSEDFVLVLLLENVDVI